ncbi:AAA family ATPase [Thermodesulfobacterium hydrogeniphilum]|uniref:ATP-binding protein n=1 Tax=Thermodesulfobacterium hydrogeniphilum TaxID=161156 RepID=UPI000570683F|nr:AAA family ATPase [Thermodesulfobacterium hydrogeniphilum]
MPIKISFVGKGGTGKTTLSALLVNYFIDQKQTPILVVDADPNFNLNELLGVEIETTLSEIREELLKGDTPEFMSRYDYVEMRVNEALIETKDFDLLVMGYPETSGCYCPVHAFLSNSLEKLMNNYPYVIIDNEAGMEHISRLNLREMEHLIIVSDANPRGILTGGRIAELVRALKIQVSNLWLIVNQSPEIISEDLKSYTEEITKKYNIKLLGFLPEDPNILNYELKHIPVFEWQTLLKTKAYELFNLLWE